MFSDFVRLFILARVRSPNLDKLILRCSDNGIVVLHQRKVANPVSMGEVLGAELGGVTGLRRIGGGGAGLAGEV